MKFSFRVVARSFFVSLLLFGLLIFFQVQSQTEVESTKIGIVNGDEFSFLYDKILHIEFNGEETTTSNMLNLQLTSFDQSFTINEGDEIIFKITDSSLLKNSGLGDDFGFFGLPHKYEITADFTVQNQVHENVHLQVNKLHLMTIDWENLTNYVDKVIERRSAQVVAEQDGLSVGEKLESQTILEDTTIEFCVTTITEKVSIALYSVNRKEIIRSSYFRDIIWEKSTGFIQHFELRTTLQTEKDNYGTVSFTREEIHEIFNRKNLIGIPKLNPKNILGPTPILISGDYFAIVNPKN
ncbi:MAG: hypothetical protein IH840_07800 [Candidatus Heimdallarchaeota archaeon]|nr:hypothetical protein [Candidatus Heimdallarchaeota archaeon]